MNNELTLEQLRFAQLNGLNFYTGGTGTYNNHQFLKDINGKAYCLKDNGTMFKAAEESAASLADVYKINFTPLDEAGLAEPKSDMPSKPRNKYMREIKPGVWVDVYDVIQAWKVTNSAQQHLIKKALQGGQRGHKDYETDMRDIIASATRAIELDRAAQELGK